MKINPEFTEKVLTRFIKNELAKFGFTKGILGLSGGLDSAVCAALAAKALSPKNVIALIMPYGNIFPRDVEDARKLAQTLGVQHKIIDISPMIDCYFKAHPIENRVLKGNKMARERMSILYDYSARKKALVLGTSNKTELLLGYSTVHGDTASAINPLGDLYKTQVRQLAEYLGIPENILKKKPSAGLWVGQTDEEDLGMDYNTIDKILFFLVDERKTKEEIIKLGHKESHLERISSLIVTSEFKRKLPIIPKLSWRTIGIDFLYPYDRGK